MFLDMDMNMVDMDMVNEVASVLIFPDIVRG